MPPRTGVFLDRDGTVIVDRDYPGDPGGVELLPGAASAVARLNRAGLPVLLVTNQSGIARGLITEADFRAVQRRVEALLAVGGARLAAVYHCPHGPDTRPACECRKPRLGMFRQGAREHGLAVAGSFFVGDRLRDVTPALELGGTGILVGATEPPTADPPAGVERLPSLEAAVDRILAGRPFD